MSTSATKRESAPVLAHKNACHTEEACCADPSFAMDSKHTVHLHRGKQNRFPLTFDTLVTAPKTATATCIPINDPILLPSLEFIRAPCALALHRRYFCSVASISIPPCDMFHSDSSTGISPANVSIHPPLLEEICAEILYHGRRSTAGTYALCSRNSALVARNHLCRDEDSKDELGKMVRTLNLPPGKEKMTFTRVLTSLRHSALVDSFVGQLEMFTYSFPVCDAVYDFLTSQASLTILSLHDTFGNKSTQPRFALSVFLCATCSTWALEAMACQLNDSVLDLDHYFPKLEHLFILQDNTWGKHNTSPDFARRMDALAKQLHHLNLLQRVTIITTISKRAAHTLCQAFRLYCGAPRFRTLIVHTQRICLFWADYTNTQHIAVETDVAECKGHHSPHW
ncbi:hypothetical protein C8R44DRAFT_890269 [Mycena epipterygia]|nr:hypothetical protein C8R44DRAFT_890269 [Mycena epipterygia]